MSAANAAETDDNRPRKAKGPMEQRKERVFVETERHRIAGTITLPRDGYRSRVSDLLNATERDFISLTDATVELIDHDGPGTEHEVIAISRKHIVFAILADGDRAGDRAGGFA
jgi:hypothetical protein